MAFWWSTLMYAQMQAPKIMAAVRTLSDMPIKYIVNTHVHGDHTGGNGALAKLGGGGAMPRIIANDHVLNRIARCQRPAQTAVPESDWPNDEYFNPTKDFFFNNEAVIVYHMPAAHTDGDSVVFFRRSDVISTGDIFTPNNYPLIDLQRGGSVQGIIDALNRIIELTVPAKYQEGGTYVIPGHGRLCEEADVVEYRDMVTIIRDRIADLIKKGKTLEQVKSAKTDISTTTHTARKGIWTDRFIEADLQEPHCEEETMKHQLKSLNGSVTHWLRLSAGEPICAGPAGRRGGPPPVPKTAKEAAPVDLTGYWVSVVTEDWRWRMVTPIAAILPIVPLNPANGRKLGGPGIRPATKRPGEQCRAYGAPAIMRVPGRVHITWQDDNTLKIETDAGTQTRLFHFTGKAPENGKPGWQGYSEANWEKPVRGEGLPLAGLGAYREGNKGRSLEVVTTQLRPGYLRKNGAPYSANVVLNEYYDFSKEPNGDTWFHVTTIVKDPQYLRRAFCHEHRLQEAARWRGLESFAVYGSIAKLSLGNADIF